MKPNKRRKRKRIDEAFIRENFSDRQWQSFESNEELSSAKSEEMHRFVLNEIFEKQAQKQTGKIKLIQFSKFASAACVTVLLGFALYLGVNNVSNQVKINPVAKTTVQSFVAENTWKTINNKDQEILNYRLPDASLVTIYPHSSIKFKSFFNQKLRDVYLTGKAKFKVKRNTSRPFSVYSGVLKTTALGTSFTINTKGKNISVKLHTGKIVVANVKTKRPLAYISSVGTTLMYDPNLESARFIRQTKLVKALMETISHEGTVINMKNIPLAKVFDLLHEAYGIKISTDQKEINRITFTGKVDTVREKPEDILKVICLINNMTFTKVSENEFFIQKSN
ncbi:FecR family protein [Pedobacter agri]|uniref:FecR family protein n=1 Tax=Pedobacter agri TaxID=454586 RepID=UPI00277E0EC0|nr:FecR family protein [Pedobacter agri]MDQ1142678.1 transmembrane sensor [Pedobacter agri]